MSAVKYVPVDQWMLEEIAANIRPSDREEIVASGWQDTLSALEASVRMSDTSSVAVIDGVPAAVLGVAKKGGILTPYGCPWLLGSTVLHEHRRLLLTEAPRVRDYMKIKYGHLENYVFAGSKQSVIWLQRIGFEMHEKHRHPATGEAFYRFSL